MKRHELVFSVVKVPLDFLVVFTAFFLAREFRLVTDYTPGISWFRLPFQTISNENLIGYALFGGGLYILLMAFHGLYNIKLTASKIKESFDIILYTFYWFIFFSVFLYLGKGVVYQAPELPRLIILYTFVFSCVLVVLQRIILNYIQRLCIWLKVFDKRSLLLINNLPYQEIKHIIHDIEQSGIYSLYGYVNKKKGDISRVAFKGSYDDIASYIEERKIDEILYIDSDFSKKELFKIWELSRVFGIRYRYITNSFDITKTNTSLSMIHSIPVVEINNTPLDNWSRVLKRAFDIIFGSLGIVFFTPIILFFGILIKIEDPKGPIIYKNRRIGQNGHIFFLYKLRYMKWKYCVKDAYGVDEKEDEALKYENTLIQEKSKRTGPLYKISNDPRKTRIGKFLEKYSLDELPQFYNVFFGSMSLVGPRPHQPREVNNYDIIHKRLLTVKPGITGMAQVNGRENNDFNDEANLDIFYIENWSFLLDIKIIFKTIVTILFRK